MRLYTPEKEERRELIDIKECVGSEHISLNLYQVKGGELLRKYAGKIQQPCKANIESEKNTRRGYWKKLWKQCCCMDNLRRFTKPLTQRIHGIC